MSKILQIPVEVLSDRDPFDSTPGELELQDRLGKAQIELKYERRRAHIWCEALRVLKDHSAWSMSGLYPAEISLAVKRIEEATKITSELADKVCFWCGEGAEAGRLIGMCDTLCHQHCNDEVDEHSNDPE